MAGNDSTLRCGSCVWYTPLQYYFDHDDTGVCFLSRKECIEATYTEVNRCDYIGKHFFCKYEER